MSLLIPTPPNRYERKGKIVSVGEHGFDQSSLVIDPYGRYYGSKSFAETKTGVAKAVSRQQRMVQNLTRALEIMQSSKFKPNSSSKFSLSNRLSESSATLESLQAFDEGRYTQQPQMEESYDKYAPQWDTYFKSAHSNRFATEDNERAAQLNQAKMGVRGAATGNQQLVSSNLGIRKEIGTGVGKTNVGLNPFGKLDAGLNI